MSQVTTRIVVEGPSHLVLHAFLESNGYDGELDNHVLLSPVDLTPKKTADEPALRIMQVWYSMVWFDVVLKFGGIVPRPVWTLTRDSQNHIDFRAFGGASDYGPLPPSDQNGKLLISTNGFAPIGSQGSLVLELRKR